MSRNKIWLLILLILLLSGCAKPKTLEQIGLVTTKGYDIDKDGMIKGTLFILTIDPAAKQQTTVLTTKALTVRGIRIQNDLKSSKKLLSGQLRVALFSEELARRGIKPFIDTLIRDPSISDLTYLAIVQGKSEDLLTIENIQIPDIGQHIFKEIDHNVKWALIPSSTIHETLHGISSVGIDAVTPILKKIDNRVEVSGLALYKNNKMVGKLKPNKSFYIRLLKSPIRSGEFEIPISGDLLGLDGEQLINNTLAVALDTTSARTKIKLINKKNLEFNLKLKINVRLEEINADIHIKKAKTVHLLEKVIAKKMEKDIESIITYCQSVQSDPIGFGEVYRSSVVDSHLTSEKWHKMFPRAKVNVKVDFSIVKTGLTE